MHTAPYTIMNFDLISVSLKTVNQVHLLVSQGVHVADDLSRHFPRVSGTILEGSLDDGHDQSQGGGVNEVDKLSVQQGLQTCLSPPGGVSEGVQQDGGDRCEGGATRLVLKIVPSLSAVTHSATT